MTVVVLAHEINEGANRVGRVVEAGEALRVRACLSRPPAVQVRPLQPDPVVAAQSERRAVRIERPGTKDPSLCRASRPPAVCCSRCVVALLWATAVPMESSAEASTTVRTVWNNARVIPFPSLEQNARPRRPTPIVSGPQQAGSIAATTGSAGGSSRIGPVTTAQPEAQQCLPASTTSSSSTPPSRRPASRQRRSDRAHANRCEPVRGASEGTDAAPPGVRAAAATGPEAGRCGRAPGWLT